MANEESSRKRKRKKRKTTLSIFYVPGIVVIT